MAATSKSFEVMYGLMSAVKQIDRIVASDPDDILEDVMTAVKEINLDKFDKSIKQNIVNNIRNGLIEMYQEQQIIVNKEIGLGTEFSEVPIESAEFETDPSSIIKHVM